MRPVLAPGQLPRTGTERQGLHKGLNQHRRLWSDEVTAQQVPARVRQYLAEVAGILHRPPVRGVGVVCLADEGVDPLLPRLLLRQTDGSHLWRGEDGVRHVTVITGDR